MKLLIDLLADLTTFAPKSIWLILAVDARTTLLFLKSDKKNKFLQFKEERRIFSKNTLPSKILFSKIVFKNNTFDKRKSASFANLQSFNIKVLLMPSLMSSMVTSELNIQFSNIKTLTTG